MAGCTVIRQIKIKIKIKINFKIKIKIDCPSRGPVYLWGLCSCDVQNFMSSMTAGHI